jgi:hydroxyquinol 1,2-dioxygenase
VFGVKQSLVRAFPAVYDPDRARTLGLPNPFRSVDFEISLQRADGDGDGAAPGTTSTGT